MNKDHLTSVRQQILDSLLPLIMNDNGDPAERFSLIVSAIKAGAGTDELYDKALEVAGAIENEEDRRVALYDLLGEVEADIDQLSRGVSPEQASEAQSSE